MSAGVTMNLSLDGASDLAVRVDDLVIAGWTGRDSDSIGKHIAELEAIGVKRPSTVPCFYRVSAALLTSAETIQASGTASSGEVEFVLYGTPDGMLVGTGSDHTDREVEAYSVTVSKQMCFKPVSRDVWRFEAVAPHWDELMLRSWAVEKGEKRLYQEGPVTAMKPPEELIGLYLDGAAALPAGMAMFCGTLAVHGGVAAAERFEFEIEDPVLGRKISHGYAIEALPVIA